MYEFCEICHSLKMQGYCSNQKCERCIGKLKLATFAQIEYIKDMSKKLKIEESKYDFLNMSCVAAIQLIQELQGMIDLHWDV